MLSSYPKICVVMSTYNGEKYIKAQINSILRQAEVDLKLYIRDDGSSDRTVHIIKQYTAYNESVFLEEGKNVGLNKSFWTATKNAMNEFSVEYFAFADQDDEWVDRKLVTAINQISGNEDIPYLYYSNLIICDKDINVIGTMYQNNIVSSSYQQSLAQIFCWGCTCVFNRLAATLYTRNYYEYSHDCWLFYICMFCGGTYYDHNSYIHYRRHGGNFGNSGKPIYNEGISRTKILFDKIKSFKNMTPFFSNMSLSMLSEYQNELHKDAVPYLTAVAEYRTNPSVKIKLILTRYIYTVGWLKNYSIKLRVLLNKW